MQAQLVNPASGLAVSLEEARANLRDPPSEMDGQVEMWVRGITKNAERIMQRAILHQDWLATLEAFSTSIRLPMAPLVSVAYIKYYDPNNALQTLDPQTYYVSDKDRGVIEPIPGTSWPATYRRSDAIQVGYKCGYGPDSSSTPDDIRLYILAKLVEMFDPASTGAAATVGKPYTVSFIDSMLDGYVIY